MIHGFFCLVLSLERKTPPTHCKISKYDAGQETPIRLLNSVTSAKDKYQSSQKSSAEIIQAVTGGGELSNANHLLELREERGDGQKNRDDANDTKLKGLVGYLTGANWRIIPPSKKTGAWLNVRGTKITGTV